MNWGKEWTNSHFSKSLYKNATSKWSTVLYTATVCLQRINQINLFCFVRITAGAIPETQRVEEEPENQDKVATLSKARKVNALLHYLSKSQRMSDVLEQQYKQKQQINEDVDELLAILDTKCPYMSTELKQSLINALKSKIRF